VSETEPSDRHDGFPRDGSCAENPSRIPRRVRSDAGDGLMLDGPAAERRTLHAARLPTLKPA